MAHLVFVYGTLKRGFENFELGGMARHRFVAPARTRLAYPLVLGPDRWVYVLPEPGLGHRVRGELFEVDDAGLSELDAFEWTHLPTYYHRARLEVTPEDEGAAPVEAWAYFRERRHIADPMTEPMEEYLLGL